MDYIASISYPLYFVHAVNGYVLLTLFISNGINIYLSIIITIIIIIGISSFIHFTIETKSIALGKRLLRQINKSNMS